MDNVICPYRTNQSCEIVSAISQLPVIVTDVNCTQCKNDIPSMTRNRATLAFAMLALTKANKPVPKSIVNEALQHHKEFLKIQAERTAHLYRAWIALHRYPLDCPTWNSEVAKQWVWDWFNNIEFKYCDCESNWPKHKEKLCYDSRKAFFESTILVHSDISASIQKPRMSLNQALVVYAVDWSKYEQTI